MTLGTEVGLGPGHNVLDEDPAPPTERDTAAPSHFRGLRTQACVRINHGPCLLRPNGWMDQDATRYGGRPRSMRHCVTWRPSFPSRKEAQNPHFSARVYCGQMTRWIHLGKEVGLGPGDCVRSGPIPPRKGHSSPHFSAHVYCGQTAGWLRIPLGTEVVHGQGDIALDRDLSPILPMERGTTAPTFGSLCSGTVDHLSNC